MGQLVLTTSNHEDIVLDDGAHKTILRHWRDHWGKWKIGISAPEHVAIARVPPTPLETSRSTPLQHSSPWLDVTGVDTSGDSDGGEAD